MERAPCAGADQDCDDPAAAACFSRGLVYDPAAGSVAKARLLVAVRKDRLALLMGLGTIPVVTISSLACACGQVSQNGT
jgi:hypothetical protein